MRDRGERMHSIRKAHSICTECQNKAVTCSHKKNGRDVLMDQLCPDNVHLNWQPLSLHWSLILTFSKSI